MTTALTDQARRTGIAILGVLGFFWGAVLIAGAGNPHYVQTRDYISALASVGAHRPWLGMLAIASMGIALLLTSPLLRPVSRTAAVAVVLAGAGYVIVSFARIRCVEGAAFCGVGDRSSTDLMNGRGYVHLATVVASTLLLVVAMVALGIALLRGGRKTVGTASIVAGLVTLATYVLAPDSSPGGMQRLQVATMTLWAASVAGSALWRSRSSVAPQPTSTPAPFPGSP